MDAPNLTRAELEVACGALRAVRVLIETRTLEYTRWGEVVLLEDVRDVIGNAIATLELIPRADPIDRL